MPTPKPLTPSQAKRTLVARFGPRVNRLRQLSTRFGLRPYRVFLVWYAWTGEEPGEGSYTEVKSIEILPTPQVSESTRYDIRDGGKVMTGTYSVRKVSPTLTEDLLRGQVYPTTEKELPRNLEFFYELVEDGRGDSEPLRRKCKLDTPPFRLAGKLDWNLTLVHVDESNTRDDQLAYP